MTEDVVKVMIVDDDPWTVRALTAVLGDDPGIRVVGTAATGEAAIERFRGEGADVVLMDINLGTGISGVDAADRLRRIDPRARVVILSTISDGAALVRAIEAGAVAVVHKSASDEELRGIVHRAAAEDDPRAVRHLAEELAGGLVPELNIPVPRLTERELIVLRLVCRGMEYAQIAQELVVEVTTVKAHARSLRQKLGASSLAQLVVRALQFRYLSV